ncbi:lipoprotein [Pectobacteriaceae bacterium CE70]|nr:lipoprotein [Pectobacteriaceae bacterium CE70]WJY10630.1 lipoprotein [Pectobacteriaceae bacterium C80]
MINLFRHVCLALTVLVLAGCGLKGPLYFPPEKSKAPAPAKTTQQQHITKTPQQSPVQQ